MGTYNLILLTLLLVAFFFMLMVFSQQDLNKVYLKYILITYPFMAIDLFPRTLSTSIFDFITIAFLLFFYKPKKVFIQFGKTYLYLFVLLTLFSIAGIFNADTITKDTTSALLQLGTTFCFAKILLDECVSDDGFIFTILNILKFTLFISLIFLGFQLVYGTAFTFERNLNLNVYNSSSIRYPSFFQDPQKFAQFLAISSLLLFIQKKSNSVSFILNLGLLIVTLVAMMLTGGRAGLGGWCIGLLIILLFGGKKYRIPILTVSAFLFFIVYNYTEHFPMFNRLTTLNEDYEFRYAIWQDAFQIFKDNPTVGIGIGNYANYVSIHNPDQVWSTEYNYSYFDHPESGYLKFLTEFGLIGFLSIISLILYPIYRGFKTYFSSGNYIILILIGALISWLVGFYTIYSLDDTRIRILVVTILCLLISKSKLINSNAAL